MLYFSYLQQYHSTRKGRSHGQGHPLSEAFKKCLCTHDSPFFTHWSFRFMAAGSNVSWSTTTLPSVILFTTVCWSFFSFSSMSASCLVLAFSFSVSALSIACVTFAHCSLFVFPWTASDNFCDASAINLSGGFLFSQLLMQTLAGPLLNSLYPFSFFLLFFFFK